MSSGGDDDSGAPRALTAAEKRAARRARVLAGGERRLKLLTGEIGSLKAENDALEKAMDDGVMELLGATELPTEKEEEEVEIETPQHAEKTETEATFPPRVDPAQRRRDAQARRQKKEAMVQEILAGGAAAPSPSLAPLAVGAIAPTSQEIGAVVTTEKKAEPAFSRHTTALRLQAAEEKLIFVAVLGAALYLAFAADLRTITTDLLTSDARFLSYKQLFANGVSLDSIRQQMQRENLEPTLMHQIERVFVSQLRSDAASASSSPVRSLLPNLLDLPGFFASLVLQPPILVCVLLLRVLVGLLAGFVHRTMDLPDVKNPQDDDLGFVANLALSSRPALKGYLAKARKSVDDVFLFLWSFLLAVAARAVAAAHYA